MSSTYKAKKRHTTSWDRSREGVTGSQKRRHGKEKKRKRSAHNRRKPPIMKLLHVSLRRTALNKRSPWQRKKLQCLVASLKVCDTSVFPLSVII
jgi:hypothetical protein